MQTTQTVKIEAFGLDGVTVSTIESLHSHVLGLLKLAQRLTSEATTSSSLICCRVVVIVVIVVIGHLKTLLSTL